MKKSRNSLADSFAVESISEEATQAKEPAEFLELFIDEDLLKLICEQSNLYALQNNKTLNVTPEEIKVVLAGMFLSSITPVRNKKLYWSSEDHVPHILANAMRRDRFLDILHNIHFSDNTVQSTDRAYKLRPLLTHLSKAFQYHGNLEEFLSIDESMIPYYGKHYAKQFIRGKPIRFGFKMWALCSKYGYLHAFDMYMGKQSYEEYGDTPQVGLGGNIVIKLLNDANVVGGKNHKVFFDNYFTSVSLMEFLSEKGIFASGTCRSNRTERCPIAIEKKVQTRSKRNR